MTLTLSDVARRKWLVLILVGLLPIVARLAELTWKSAPAPIIGDEFAYLVAGDTFAHARITNPPHPLWIHFETFHVIQHPTYSAQFPFAQGIILALGEVFFRSPWIGVVISIGLMCASLCWMLQGWVSRSWALVGGILAATMFFNHYWMDSYWGGAAAAIGGALVVGALPRLRRGSPIAGWWLAGGCLLLASSRPYEGLLVAAPAAIAALVWAWKARRLAPILIPLCGFTVCFSTFSFYYNWRITGKLLQSPYVLYDATYSPDPIFHFQHLPPTPHYNNSQMASAYLQELDRYKAEAGVKHTFKRLLQILELAPDDLGSYPKRLWAPLNVLMLLVFPWLLTSGKFRAPMICFTLVVAGMLPTRTYFEHYSAPVLAIRLLLWIVSLRLFTYLALRRKNWLLRLFPAALAVSFLLLVFVYVFRSTLATPELHGIDIDRPRLIAELTRLPGKHLVVVQYSANHDPNREWVYNSADIDDSRIVWARAIGGIDNGALLRHFADRRVWLVKPDELVIRLLPFGSPADGENERQGAAAGLILGSGSGRRR